MSTLPDITLERETGGWTADALARLPARPGVISFESTDGGTILLGSTGNLRRFAASRLGLDPDAPPTRVNLNRDAARLLAWRVGASFEGDVVYLREARRRLAPTYRATLDASRAWCVRLSPEDPAPSWRKIDVTHATGETLRLGELFGPIADKHAAARFGEALDDLFDLCRYPRELERAPDGQACAYKEMGRCAAPCDGSESMDSYRERVREACAFASAPVGLTVGAIEREMSEAAGAMDFERASTLKDRIVRAKQADRPSMRWATRLDRLRLLAVEASVRRGWARLFLCDAMGVEAVCDVRGDAGRDVCESVLASVSRARRFGPADALTPGGSEALGLVSQRLYHPRRGVGGLVPIEPIADGRELARAVRKAARVADTDEVSGEDEADHEVGA